MNNINIPGFTAEVSLYKATGGCRHTAAFVNAADGNYIVPQLKSCGGCSSLKWPNGTPTGACSRACCTTIYIAGKPHTSCSSESCPCQGGGGGSGLGGGFGGVLWY